MAVSCTYRVGPEPVPVEPTDCATISYQNDVKSIIATRCATTGCHSSGTFLPLVEFSNIKAQAGSIKEQVVSKAMPKGSTLSDDAIKKITCWVDAGAPNN